MEKLLSPDIGLSIWTLIAFGLLVVVLGKAAWKPLIEALEEREHTIKAEREAAEAARKAAEELKASLDAELAKLAAKAQEAMAAALKEGSKAKDEIMKQAQEEARVLAEKTRRQLEDDKNRLVGELRKEVAGLSVLAAERLLKKAVDPGVQKKVLDEFMADLGKTPLS